MAVEKQVPTRGRRGRPRIITPERIAEAGIKIGLADITFVGVAAELGVSHMALYKHVPNLQELKRIVAAEIFNRWQIPEVGDGEYDGLESYLAAFTASLRTLVKTYPGLAPYLIRRAAATPSMMAKIHAHHCRVGQVFGISKADAQWVLAMVAFHCIAVADTVYSTAKISSASLSEDSADNAEIEADFELGMRTLIAGALLRLNDASARLR
ncbi:TetR family transcriptional regulator [Advenella sp. S44]|uniref:TetR/AcrR family transcriptional regulator n=1 Tax=Advenella sp. S44 TaxID=1982755 RepID=UPI000C2A6CD8|nr:TetR family transcriptional regulator [Advenella sp. S44]PJX24107.1 TetR family transcriptional regulator [Advenella sp. S44]